ncbi:hypothetical protein QE152_g40982 [Popillia japonica]|uniref:Reverse transcriptase domain-containing protein n=1 Tax=Popillia japonica TaxID=7064 RepID=A0AAW1HEX4_POPJA
MISIGVPQGSVLGPLPSKNRHKLFCNPVFRRAGVSIGIPQGSALGPSLSELIILYRLEKEGEIKAGIPLGSILGPLFCFSGRVKK